ncbi:unnamed protein product [Bursaphelenchus okinawaensis]|uniref:Uncharacterized protein n=1 Tax=Bursaphelenchus okinawaensis TaxID=465554 RepID=A0A811L576_9BILA|nr:unnamed protein product [Bursaphelenchus okinawaensis]CAG9117785.1 unnamed protein product [Bursaphelenchus okinawaensis]
MRRKWYSKSDFSFSKSKSIWNITFDSNVEKDDEFIIEFVYNATVCYNEEEYCGMKLVEYDIETFNEYNKKIVRHYLVTNTTTLSSVSSLLPVYTEIQDYDLELSITTKYDIITNGEENYKKGNNHEYHPIHLNSINDIFILIGNYVSYNSYTRNNIMVNCNVLSELANEKDTTCDIVNTVMTVIEDQLEKMDYNISIVRLPNTETSIWFGNILTLPYYTTTTSKLDNIEILWQKQIEITAAVLKYYFGNKVKGFDEQTRYLNQGVARYMAVKMLQQTMDSKEEMELLNDISQENIKNTVSNKIMALLFMLEEVYSKEILLKAIITYYNDNKGKTIYSEKLGMAFENAFSYQSVCRDRLSISDVIYSWLTNLNVDTNVYINENFTVSQSSNSYSDQKNIPLMYLKNGGKDVFYLKKFIDYYITTGFGKWSNKMATAFLKSLMYQHDQELYCGHFKNKKNYSNFKENDVYKSYSNTSKLLEEVATGIINSRPAETSVMLTKTLQTMYYSRSSSSNKFKNVFRNYIYGQVQMLSEKDKDWSVSHKYIKSLINNEAIKQKINEVKKRVSISTKSLISALNIKNDTLIFDNFMNTLDHDNLNSQVCVSVSNLNYQNYNYWKKLLQILHQKSLKVLYESTIKSIENGLQCLWIF